MKTRKQPRQPVSATGTCSHLHGAAWAVHLDDLTVDGCRIADPQSRLAKGQRVHISVDGRPTHRAEVCWWRKGEAGIAFERPLSDSLLTELRDQSLASGSAGASTPTARYC